MSIDNALASVAVKELNKALPWYEKVLGRHPDGKPMPELAEWNFGGGGVLQVYQGPERAGRGSFTLAVTRIDQEIERLRTLGVDTGKELSGPGVRTVMIKDPDGNSIAFAEAT
jgi:predicted enzyme related to lactoylglutathione lyase